MKTKQLCALSVILAALAVGSGCQTSGHRQADSTAMRMDDLRGAVAALKEKAHACATSLTNVVETREVDPVPAFDAYQKNVDAFVSWVSKAESELKSMKAEGQKYFAAWEQQTASIQDPDLKETAEKRRARLGKAVDEVSTKMDAARAELTPFMASIQDVEKYLSSDLTPSGIDSISSKAKKVGKDADSLGEALDEVVEALDEGAPEFKTAKPPPPPPATTEKKA